MTTVLKSILNGNKNGTIQLIFWPHSNLYFGNGRVDYLNIQIRIFELTGTTNTYVI